MTTLDASVPFRYVPIGASDSLDSTSTFPGAMSSLSNLIPDQTTRSIWVCRPAAIELTDFTGFTTPGAVSVLLGVGTRVYGMLATGRNAGKDEPFSYNTATSTFDTITGVTNANSPTTQATTGAWTPPTIALVGTKIIITHPGFSGGAGVFFGVLDIANPAAPTWVAANTATNALPVIPTAVAQFSGRAWFAVNPPTGQPATYASDILDPLTVTNSSQILTYGDNRPLTALGSLGITNHITGSVVQSLIVFKASVGIFQVTGDFATSNIARNALPIATGTDSPRSICSTPKGLGFVSPDGLRIMGNDSVISDPIGMDGTGITVPFSYASIPSRMVASCNGDTVRISVQNGYLPTAPNQEWWFHLARGVWSGPHTFPMSQITALGTYFIGAPVGVTGKLFRSEAKQLSSSTYTENGTALQWRWETAYLPDPGTMAETSIIESTVNLAYPNTAGSINITAQNETESVIDAVSVTTSGDAPIWGTMVWGAFTWGGTTNTYQSRVIPWTKPIVFRRLKLSVSGDSGAATRVGDAYLRYNPLMYLQQN
jgi:hypothetical protein